MRALVAALQFCLAGIAGAQGPVANAGQPYGSPDAKWIAFHSSRDGTPDLYVIGVDGTGLRRLTSDEAREGVAGWTPDSRAVVFVQSAAGTSPVAQVSRPVIAVGLDGAVRTLGHIVGRGGAVSPDGRSIAYSGGRPQASGMVVAAIDGSGPRVLSDTTRAAAFNFAWSPDGRRIAHTQMTLGTDRVLSIHVVGADGRGDQALGSIPAAEGSAQWPAWSPDGRRVAVQVGKYDRTDPAKSTAHIWLIDVATGAATKLAAHDRPYLDETPSWVGPDLIAFQSDRTGRMEIWVMSADGSEARQVTR